MKAFNKICIMVGILIALIFVSANMFIMNTSSIDSGRPYQVEISRMAVAIEKNGYENIDLSGCKYITDVKEYSENTDFYNSNKDYAMRKINNKIYRFDYTTALKSNKKIIVSVNIVLAVMTVTVAGVMLYIRIRILAPFEKLTTVPYELSKGNLTSPVKETPNRFFGKFIWGIDLLRENIENNKSRELNLQKEKKTLLLSLSHDIKTPLSTIKLYSKALSKGLYTDKEKQIEIAENINSKADEIESYVSQIIRASNEDFLQLDVKNDEFYLSELVNSITDYYTEKLALVHIDFSVNEYSNCLISGDSDRSVEVLQNVIENAVKYGDGKTIKILFRQEEDCQLITVKNSGCTLPDTEILHIFDSFWRGSNSDNQNGSGLGLYICRQLMRKMNGEIFAELEDDFMNVTAVFRKV